MYCSSLKPLASVYSRFLLGACLCLFLISARAGQDPLPAWNDGSSKRAIIDFVQRVTTSGGPDYVTAMVMTNNEWRILNG